MIVRICPSPGWPPSARRTKTSQQSRRAERKGAAREPTEHIALVIDPQQVRNAKEIKVSPVRVHPEGVRINGIANLRVARSQRASRARASARRTVMCPEDRQERQRE